MRTSCLLPRKKEGNAIINIKQEKKENRISLVSRGTGHTHDNTRTLATVILITMAGLGRRSHYRKHLTDSVLNDLPEPNAENGERIAKVVATRGGNMFEVLVAAPVFSACHEENEEGNKSKEQSPSSNQNKEEEVRKSSPSTDLRTPQLAILPTKFHKLVWVKRNDFVIVQAGAQEDGNGTDANGEDGGGIRHIISHILYKEQVKHLKTKNLWPVDDEEFITSNDTTELAEKEAARGGDGEALESDEEEYDDLGEEDGIVYNNADYDDYVNTNRIAAMTIQDSSSESDSD